ncbi:MAG: tetratricopeptide repeat protein [Arthrospira sp. PLM2.Bin9]|nr:tetratricopeptide repeat protein [Arthrospira sp. PLM2.Bin9]TVU52107.1 MAG: tetratricopeptide repeat protein [Arthrospira sp. PLM2.Bin9]
MTRSSRQVPIFSLAGGTIKHPIAPQQASLALIPILLSLGTTTIFVEPLQGDGSRSGSTIVAQAVTESDSELRDRVQTEVDSSFRRTLALLNLVLVFLFLLPTIAGVGVWFLLAKLTDQVFIVQQEIESLKADAIGQIQESINEARNTLYQLEQNTTKADEAIESLKVQTMIQVLESETEDSLVAEVLETPEKAIANNSSGVSDDSNSETSESSESSESSDSLESSESPETSESSEDLVNSAKEKEPETPSRDRIIAEAHELAKQAEKLFLSNQLESAVAAYNQALKLEPNLAEVWNNRGVVLTKLKRYQEAIASYEKAIQIRTDYPDAWSNRGVALGKLNYYQAAIFSYDRAIALKPDYLDAWNNRGQALMNLEQYDEAIASYNQAAKIRPNFYKIWYNKARCYALKGNRELAIENLKRAIRINPEAVRKFAQQEPDFAGICQEQKFQQLLNRA